MNRGSASDSSPPETPPGACPPQTDERRPMHDKKMRAETEPRASDESSRMRQTWAEVARQPETQSMEKNERVDTSNFKKTQMNEFRTNKIGCMRTQQRMGAMQLCHHHDRRVAKNRKLGFRGHVRSTKFEVDWERRRFALVVSSFDKHSLLSLILIIGNKSLPVVLFSFEGR